LSHWLVASFYGFPVNDAKKYDLIKLQVVPCEERSIIATCSQNSNYIDRS